MLSQWPYVGRRRSKNFLWRSFTKVTLGSGSGYTRAFGLRTRRKSAHAYAIQLLKGQPYYLWCGIGLIARAFPHSIIILNHQRNLTYSVLIVIVSRIRSLSIPCLQIGPSDHNQSVPVSHTHYARIGHTAATASRL